MSKGINRAKGSLKYESTQLYNECIFISHKYEDLDAARAIASYIMDSDIDVYLDDNDDGLQSAVQSNDSKKIVECIENALTESTHILVLVTKNTRMSWWVPYEVGYAKHGNISIASLLLKNVAEFPDYLKIEKTLTGYNSLEKYINDIKGLSVLFEVGHDIIAAGHKPKLLKYINS